MKGLEALQRIKNRLYPLEIEETNIIEKELKALEIIKAIKPFIVYENIGGKYYLETIVDEIGLTKDDYDLLKEVVLWK